MTGEPTMLESVRLCAADLRRLRAVAKSIAHKERGARCFTIEIAERVNVVTGTSSLNILAISEEPDWADTDLHDTWPWARIRERHILSGGKALLDRYVRERAVPGKTGDLVCCVQAELDANGLLAVHADSDQNVWRR